MDKEDVNKDGADTDNNDQDNNREPEEKFTQADLDQLVSRRLARERDNFQKDPTKFMTEAQRSEYKDYLEHLDNKAKAEEEQKQKQGQYDQLIAEKEAKHEEETNVLKQALADSETKRLNDKAAAKLSSLFVEAGGNKSAIASAIGEMLRSERFAIDPDSDKLIITNGEGERKKNSETKSGYVELDSFVADFLTERPYFLTPKSGSGYTAAGGIKRSMADTEKLILDAKKAVNPKDEVIKLLDNAGIDTD